MKHTTPKIAIYSGEVPSSTFIERLISGVAESGCEMYLFGSLKKRTTYRQPNIRRITYSDTTFSKGIHLLKYSMLLFLFKNKAKRKLDAFIKSHSPYPNLSKVKYYPVLWHHPDVFHIQWTKNINDWMWVQEFGIKLIVSLRGTHINTSPITSPYWAASYTNCFPKVDGFHAVSKAIVSEAQKYGASPKKIQVVYSGLDPIEIPLRKSVNPRFKMIAVGRKHWVKGYPYALESCHLLKNAGMDFDFQIIGAADSEELQYQRVDLGLEKEVQLLGKLPFIEVQQRIQAADVLLLSSVEEGIANVVLEAMQLGTLVLSTDCGGMGEVIKDGVNGFLVPIRNPEAMAAAIQKIQKLSREEKEKIIAAAQETIENRYTTTTMVKGMLGLYNQVLEL